MITKAQCHVCQGGPFLLKTLYSHLRRVHRSEEEIQEVQAATRKAINHDKEEVKCEICGKEYYSTRGLRYHKAVFHKEEEPRTSNETGQIEAPVTCPACNDAFHKNVELAAHCEKEHDDGLTDFSILKKTFESWEKFEEWMTKKERETFSKLVRRCVRKASCWNTYTYTCQHARGEGETVDPAECKERYKKSKRVHKHCPCFAKAKQNRDGTVDVTACFGHLGHEINSAASPLSEEDEAVVKSYITAGVPYQTIVSKLRTSQWVVHVAPEKQARICFLTVRDVANIAARNGLIDGRSSADDRASLRLLIKEQENIAAVKLVESEDLSGDGFILAFVTRYGKKYLERYGNRGLVFDDTFNVTRYSFRLATLLVVDDGGNGYPCAHLLSFRMSTSEVKILFELVKACVPGLDPEYVMTDDTHVFYNSFKDIFPDSRAIRVLCTFHISQTLQRKHKEVLHEASAVSTANKLVESMLVEVEPTKFESSFAAYMTWLASIGAVNMISYIERNYSARRQEWAVCYRQRAPFMTTNHAESWHNKLKHILLCSKQSARLDTITYALIRHSLDRHLQLISASVRGGCDASGRRKRNVRRHKDALQHYKEITNNIRREGVNCWSVPSKSRTGVTYCVTVDSSACDCSYEVNSHCERCGICPFQVSCNCHDAYQAGVSCVHAHAVATFAPEATELLRRVSHRLASDRSRSSSSAAITTEDNGAAGHILQQLDLYSGNASDSEVHRSPARTTPAEDVAAMDKKKEALQYVEGKIAHLSEVVRSLAKKEQYDMLRRCGEMIDGFLELVPTDVTKRHPFARRLEMQTTGAGPRPAPIQPQFRRRSALQAVRRQQKTVNKDFDVESEAQRILETDRRELLICFICGKREPEEDGENHIFWLSCSNQERCKAWAHVACTSGVGGQCSICKDGHWRIEDV